MTTFTSTNSSSSPPLPDSNKNSEETISTEELLRQRNSLLLQAALHLHAFAHTPNSSPLDADVIAKLELLPSKVFDQKLTWTAEIKHFCKTSLSANLLVLGNTSASNKGKLLEDLVLLLASSQQHLSHTIYPPLKKTNTEPPLITFDTAIQQLPHTNAHRGNLFLFFNIASLLQTGQRSISSSSSPTSISSISSISNIADIHSINTYSISLQLLCKVKAWVEENVLSTQSSPTSPTDNSNHIPSSSSNINSNTSNSSSSNNNNNSYVPKSQPSSTSSENKQSLHPFDSNGGTNPHHETLSYQLLHLFSTFSLIQLRSKYLFHQVDPNQVIQTRQEIESLFMSWDSAMLSLASSPVKGDVIEVFLSILRLLFHLKQAQSAGITTSLVHLESALELYQTKLVPILNRLSIPDKREVILWLPIQRDTDLQMIHFLGDILHLRKNEAGAIAEVKVPIEDLRMQISMLKAKILFKQGKLQDVQVLLNQNLQKPNVSSIEMTCCRANLAMMFALAKKPHTGELHSNRVLDALLQTYPTLASYPHPMISHKLLYNIALMMMNTKRYYHAFQYFQLVLQGDVGWNVLQVVKLLLRAAECCIQHHKSLHQSGSGKCRLQMTVQSSARRRYYVIRGETGEGQADIDEQNVGCNLNTARTILIQALLLIKCNDVPPSSIQIHILQNLMYICIQQEDPLGALKYGELLQPLLSPATSAVYLNLKSKALYDLKKYAEARQSILQHYQNLSTVNPAVCQTSDDCFLSRRRPHCTASDSLEDPAGVNVTANDIIDASASKLPSMAWTSLVFESNEVLCRMKQQEQIYTSGRDATESLDVANQVFEPKQLDILLQTYPRYTPLWKASIFAKLNQITSFPTQPLMTSPLQKFPEIKAMIKQYNHSVK